MTMGIAMTDRQSLEEEISKSKKILNESQENLNKNPGDYSARLLVMSIENHLTDLLRQLDKMQKE